MNRRKLMGGVGAAGAALTTVGAAAQAAPIRPDTALTVAVRRYMAARAAYDACDALRDGLEAEENLGDAYCAALDPVRDASANTLAELIAKARIAKKELAIFANGSEAPVGYVGDGIARSIVNDLLRIGDAS